METIGKRIKDLRQNKMHMSQVAFADKLNVSKQTLYKYENDIITNIPSDKIEDIAKICGVSPAYLMGWEPPRELIDVDDREYCVISALRDNPQKYYETNKILGIWQNGDSLPEGAIPYTPEAMVNIPLVGSVNCGTPLFAEDNIEGYIPTPESDIQTGETYFWLRAKGDSMLNVGIHDGDLLFIRQQNDVDSGDIAVVAINGDDATLKRVIKKENAIVLQPENPAYETKIYVGKEMEDIKIRGRLMQLRKEF